MGSIKRIMEFSDFLNSFIQSIVSNFALLLNNKIHLIGVLVFFLCTMIKVIVDILCDE